MKNREPHGSLFLYQLRMILDCLFDALGLDADVALRGGGRAVLQSARWDGNPKGISTTAGGNAIRMVSVRK